MVTIEECRKALGSLGDKLSDKEVSEMNERTSQLASVLFDMWNKDLKKKLSVVDQTPVSTSTI
jgi:hypothetical protein